MPTPRVLNLIGRGDRAEFVLAADFPATGRTVAGFGDLFAGPARPWTVWETAAPPAPGTGEEHVDRWLAEAAGLGAPVGAVLGFCVGAVYAAALAEDLSAAQGGRVPLLVFDPERPDANLLHRHYAAVIEGLAPAFDPAALAAARNAGDLALRTQGADLSVLADVLVGLLAEHGGPALRRSGLDERRTAELLGTFTAFLAYLTAAAELDPAPAWSRATAFSSASPLNGLNVLSAAMRAATVRSERRFPVGHEDFLRDAAVAAATHGLLEHGFDGEEER